MTLKTLNIMDVIVLIGGLCIKMKYIDNIKASLIVLLMISLGVNVIDNDEGYIPYSCDKESIPDMMCYKLSRVNDDGIQRNCYYNRDRSRSYKVCTTGWERLLNVDEYAPEGRRTLIIAYTDNGKYFCDGIGADVNCVKDKTLEMPFRG